MSVASAVVDALVRTACAVEMSSCKDGGEIDSTLPALIGAVVAALAITAVVLLLRRR